MKPAKKLSVIDGIKYPFSISLLGVATYFSINPWGWFAFCQACFGSGFVSKPNPLLGASIFAITALTAFLFARVRIVRAQGIVKTEPFVVMAVITASCFLCGLFEGLGWDSYKSVISTALAGIPLAESQRR